MGRAAATGGGGDQGGHESKLLVNHPLVSDGQKLFGITRALTTKQNLYVYFEVYDPAQAPGTKGAGDGG